MIARITQETLQELREKLSPYMERVGAGFRVIYRLKPESCYPCKATLTVALPCGEDGVRLHPSLDLQTEVLGEVLKPYWGHLQGKQRHRNMAFSSWDWLTLEYIVLDTLLRDFLLLSEAIENAAALERVKPADATFGVFHEAELEETEE